MSPPPRLLPQVEVGRKVDFPSSSAPLSAAPPPHPPPRLLLPRTLGSRIGNWRSRDDDTIFAPPINATSLPGRSSDSSSTVPRRLLPRQPRPRRLPRRTVHPPRPQQQEEEEGRHLLHLLRDRRPVDHPGNPTCSGGGEGDFCWTARHPQPRAAAAANRQIILRRPLHLLRRR